MARTLTDEQRENKNRKQREKRAAAKKKTRVADIPLGQLAPREPGTIIERLRVPGFKLSLRAEKLELEVSEEG